MAISDYSHHNEEAGIVWLAEEGRHDPCEHRHPEGDEDYDDFGNDNYDYEGEE